MENQNSTLAIKITKFVNQYGPDQLIELIDGFEFMGGQDKFAKYRKLEKVTCNIIGISIADMHHRSNPNCANARRIISYIAINDIQLPILTVAKLLGDISRRSVNYYINDADEWINNPRMNKPFFDKYSTIIEKFKAE